MNAPPDYFEKIAAEEGPFAKRLAEFLGQRLGTAPTIDVGCGPGIYTQELRLHGVEALGVDSDPFAAQAHPDYCFTKDILSFEYLSWVWMQHTHFALCLEVFEHIEPEYADRAVAALAATAPHILFSAAMPGQGGEHHVNCQPKHYWLHKFCRCGFYYRPAETEEIVAFARAGYHMGWFVNNAMVLRKAV